MYLIVLFLCQVNEKSLFFFSSENNEKAFKEQSPPSSPEVDSIQLSSSKLIKMNAKTKRALAKADKFGEMSLNFVSIGKYSVMLVFFI